MKRCGSKVQKKVLRLPLILEELLRQRRNQGGEHNAGTLRKSKKPKAKNKKLAGMYGNKSKITRGDIIAAAKNVRPKEWRNGR